MGGQLQLQGQQTGLPGTITQTIGPFSAACSAVQYNEQVALTTGNNTLTIPSGAAGVIVIAPTGGAVAMNLDSSSGAPLAEAGLAAVIVFPGSPPTSFVIWAAGSVTVTVQAF
jgi:hypothetical protein